MPFESVFAYKPCCSVTVECLCRIAEMFSLKRDVNEGLYTIETVNHNKATTIRCYNLKYGNKTARKR